MNCPTCGEKGASVLPDMLCPQRSIDSALNCRNPGCTAYDAITHGLPPKMQPEVKAVFQKVICAVRSESDFDLIAVKYLDA